MGRLRSTQTAPAGFDSFERRRRASDSPTMCPTQSSTPPRPDDDAPVTLRLGTRGSLLARTQSQIVANALEAEHTGVRVELIIIKTSGDQITDRPLHAFGGKGLFTKE